MHELIAILSKVTNYDLEFTHSTKLEYPLPSYWHIVTYTTLTTNPGSITLF